VVFDPEQISDQSTFEDPHRFPTGIDYVFVNGQPVVIPEGTTSNRPGAVLAR
jgi:N-acyl-D-amino-acid deacylase